MSKNIAQTKHTDATVLAVISEPTAADAARLGALLGVGASVCHRWHRLEDRRALRIAVFHNVRGVNDRFISRIPSALVG